MYILYLDDSGSAANSSEQYLVLGGLCVYEAQMEYFTRELDKLAMSIDAKDPHSVEFHASDIFGGRRTPWNTIKSRDDRRAVLKQVLEVVATAYGSARVFACAVQKRSFPNRDPMEIAFEDLCSRFDRFLGRLASDGDRQRGLIILDKSAHETSLQGLARNFRVVGTRWGSIRHLADTPVFIDSKASRLVQIADHIAYAVFRRFEAADATYFDVIAPRFDAEGGRIHGLSHRHKDTLTCMCPACLTRRLRRSKDEGYTLFGREPDEGPDDEQANEK
jgi:hypothetical protein